MNERNGTEQQPSDQRSLFDATTADVWTPGTWQRMRAVLLEAPAKQRPTITSAALVLLDLVFRFQYGDGSRVRTSVDQIAGATGMTPKAVKKVLDAFEATGAAERVLLRKIPYTVTPAGAP